MPKYYAVWCGRTAGVFDSWEACKQSVAGYAGAKFKSFKTRQLAEAALRGDEPPLPPELSSSTDRMALAVDGACSGVGGRGEYRGVLLPSRAEVFRGGPFEAATNNAMEYLAIIRGLRWMEERGLRIPLYSDSNTAIHWVAADLEHRCGTCASGDLAAEVARLHWWLRCRADRWRLVAMIRKWDTAALGEIPADFGRK